MCERLCGWHGAVFVQIARVRHCLCIVLDDQWMEERINVPFHLTQERMFKGGIAAVEESQLKRERSCSESVQRRTPNPGLFLGRSRQDKQHHSIADVEAQAR